MSALQKVFCQIFFVLSL